MSLIRRFRKLGKIIHLKGWFPLRKLSSGQERTGKFPFCVRAISSDRELTRYRKLSFPFRSRPEENYPEWKPALKVKIGTQFHDSKKQEQAVQLYRGQWADKSIYSESLICWHPPPHSHVLIVLLIVNFTPPPCPTLDTGLKAVKMKSGLWHG